MKRFTKVLMGLLAVGVTLVGIVIVGGFWLANSALNVVSDAVDNSVTRAQKLQPVAQKEAAQGAKSPQNAEVASSGNEPSPVKQSQPVVAPTPDAPAPSTTTKAPVQIAAGEASPPAKPSANKKGEDDTFAEIGGLLNLFINDGEDSADPTALLTSGDKDAKGDKQGGKDADDSLTDMIPGANSPTVKRWMNGKYKGKESQAIDDAIEDPKIWRLIFFLTGGM